MKRKNLTAAVLAGLAGAAGIVGTASAALFINPDGLGEVLIYPYYTVNAGNATLMSVVNTTDSAKAVKVRFKEGENSREVLDFNLYLSAQDVWTAAVINDRGTPTLIIPDNSCTVPYLYGNDSDGDGAGEQPFLDFDYTGGRADGGSSGIARAMEGHMEVIEMGELNDDIVVEEAEDGTLTITDIIIGDRTYGSETAATHVEDEDGNQAPLDCQQLSDQWSVLSGKDGLWVGAGAASLDIGMTTGGLFGSASIVNVLEGTLYTYDAKAIGDFNDMGDLHVKPGTSEPDLNMGDASAANVDTGGGGNTQIEYDRNIDAVSAVFMHDATMNEYVLGGPTAAESEWVITFPTEGWYVDSTLAQLNGYFIWGNVSTCTYIGDHDGDAATPVLVGVWSVYPGFAPGLTPTDPRVRHDGTLGAVITAGGITHRVTLPLHCATRMVLQHFPSDPFTSSFDGEACEVVGFGLWDASENAIAEMDSPSTLPIVSPPAPGTTTPGAAAFELCYATSILQFGDSDIFGSSNKHTVNTTFESGWARINFGLSDLHVLVGNEVGIGDDLVGLPVTGFWAAKFVNGVLPGGVLANYGSLFDHKGSVKTDTE